MRVSDADITHYILSKIELGGEFVVDLRVACPRAAPRSLGIEEQSGARCRPRAPFMRVCGG